MAFYIIGLGLGSEKDISVRGLELVRKCDEVYLETYTSLLPVTIEQLSAYYGKKIIPANRDLVEQRFEEQILPKAWEKHIALLVIGDPFSATTHIELMRAAKQRGIDVEAIGNASILTAVGLTGLQLYKFGKVTSIPFYEEDVLVETPYNILEENQSLGLHTLFLLDLDPPTERYMSVNTAISALLKLESHKKKKLFTENTLCVACARLGSDNIIKAGTAKKLMGEDFGRPPHCLIVPGKLHFLEEEALNYLS